MAHTVFRSSFELYIFIIILKHLISHNNNPLIADNVLMDISVIQLVVQYVDVLNVPLSINVLNTVYTDLRRILSDVPCVNVEVRRERGRE